MSGDSRTKKSYKNVSVALVFMVLNMLAQFFVRKAFLEYLGTELLGLNTTATNLLQFLNIAELGIGAAVGFALYKPLFSKDEEAIREIVALQGHLYRRIAYVVLGGGLILSAFFPLIFAKMQLPLWNAYATFGVLLLSALLSYFANYKQVLLSADQCEYKVFYSFRAVMITRLVVQYFAVKYLENPYMWWLITEAGFSLLASGALTLMVRRSYPFLSGKTLSGKELTKKYPQIVSKVKQVFFHKISYFVHQQTSPLIIYAFASLTLVAYYGNYLILITSGAILLNALFNGLNAGVGNLIAEGDKKKILKVFQEVFAMKWYLALVVCVVMYFGATPFICLWVGEQYLLPASTLFIMTFTLFFNFSSNTAESFLMGYGMYQDIWAPVIEAILNLGLSIAFGFIWDLNGILCGVLLSRIIIIGCWKPYFLYSKAFSLPISGYLKIYLPYVVATVVSVGLFAWIESKGILGGYATVWEFIRYVALVALLFVGISVPVMLVASPGMRMLAARFTPHSLKRRLPLLRSAD